MHTLLLLFIIGVISDVQAYGVETVINLVTDCNGSTKLFDNTNAFQYCALLAQQTSYPLYVPPGTYYFQHSINTTGIIVRGAGEYRTTLWWTKKLNNYTAAWEVYGENAQVRQLQLNSNWGRILGIASCYMYGLRLNTDALVTNVIVQSFLAGLVWNSPIGYTTCQFCIMSNNYYGIYVQNSGGNNLITIGSLAGNTMASIGVPATGYIGNGDTVFRVHMCFGPYGLYQEGPAEGTGYQDFLLDAHFNLARFESCGNGAIFSENAKTDAKGGVLHSELYNVGFSYNPFYRIPNVTYNYTVNIGAANDTLYLPGTSGFYSGTTALFSQGAAGGMFEYTTYSMSSAELIGTLVNYTTAVGISTSASVSTTTTTSSTTHSTATTTTHSTTTSTTTPTSATTPTSTVSSSTTYSSTTATSSNVTNSTSSTTEAILPISSTTAHKESGASTVELCVIFIVVISVLIL